MAFSTDDFNKVWASTSPLTPYEFSETNYKEGWNFIGSTPPARQMWDSIQKLNDEKSQYLYNVSQYLYNVNDDFFTNIISKLASDFDLPVGTTFPSTSALSKMISQMNTDDGMVFSLSDTSAWYVCLGEKFDNLIIQGATRMTSAGAWGVTAFPINVTTIYSLFATAYVNNGSTVRTPIVVTTNNPSYKLFLATGSAVDGMGYMIIGKA